MPDFKRGDPVIQHIGRDDERQGRVLSVPTDSRNVIVQFECGSRSVPRETLTLLADLRNVNDNDNVGT